jgi:hypothetical protein
MEVKVPDKPGLEKAAAAFAAEDESMIETHKVDLEPLHITLGKVALIEAEMPVERSPFVLVHYAVEGKRQRWGHRLDRDKRAFLDSFEDGSPNDIEDVADKLTAFLIPHRHALN